MYSAMCRGLTSKRSERWVEVHVLSDVQRTHFQEKWEVSRSSCSQRCAEDSLPREVRGE
jgi:hypothetical protein